MNNISNNELSAGLKKLGVTNLRPNQEAPLRAILVGKDVFVILQTGGRQESAVYTARSYRE